MAGKVIRVLGKASKNHAAPPFLRIHASNATVHKHRASGAEPLLGALHGLAMALITLLPEFLVRHPMLPLIWLHQNDAPSCHSPQCVRLTTTIGLLPCHEHPAMHATIAPMLPLFALHSGNGKGKLNKSSLQFSV